jgi:periplasmic protein TonB
MFEDSLFESSGTLSKRNPWTAALSFTMQGLLAGVLVLLPLIYTEALPGHQLTSILTEPIPPPGPPAPVSTHARGAQPRAMADKEGLRVPDRIPARIAIVHDQAANADRGGTPDWDWVPGGTGAPNSVLSSLMHIPPSMPKVVAPPKVRVSSGVAQGLLIHETKPAYPPLAMQARIQGTVLLQAVVAKDGTVQELRVISGHPLLVKAALDAVKLWRYKPYRLNDQPVEVDTQIIVNFTLGNR